MDAGLAHEPTERTHREVNLLIGFGHSLASVCHHLDINEDTLRKHYPEEVKNSKRNLELCAGAVMFDDLFDPDPTVHQPAAKWILARKCGWREDKGVDTDAQKSIFDAIVEAAAAQLLAKKEKEHEY